MAKTRLLECQKMDGLANCVRMTWMGLASAYGMRTGGMGGSKKAKMLRTYYVHSPLIHESSPFPVSKNLRGVLQQQEDQTS